MLDRNKFSEKDSENLVKLLNFVAQKGKFTLDVKEVIELYGLMAWAQQELKAKIEANILEVKSIKEPEKKSGGRKASK